MGSIKIYKGKPPLSEEQIRRIRENAPKSDDEIDLSDIPKTTEEQFKKSYRVNPRTPAEWEQFYKYCPPKRQAQLARQRKLLEQEV